VYEWYDAPAGGNLLATTSSFTTPTLNSNTNFYVRSIVNNCAGSRTPVIVNVTTRPQVTSPATAAVCTGSQLKYLATSDQSGTIFNWSRNAVAGISNAASSGITDSTISEMLTNTSGAPIAVSYQIVPANGNCIGSPFAVNVIVNPTPATPVVTSSSPVCVGSTLNLFTPAVANATYTWTGPNNFASNQQNPVLPGILLNSAGIYAVSVTVNGCTSQAGSKNIFPVIAAPAASSNAPVCAGNKLTLSAGNLTGAVYQWSGPAGFSATNQNPVINAASAANSGTYYLTASIAGCPGLTDSVKVLVNIPPAMPQVNSNSPICSSDSVVLNASGGNGTNYLWTGPNGFSSTIQNPVIRQASEQNSGTYTVIASTTGCTVTAVASVPVNVKTTPAAPTASSNSPVCEGNALNLFAMPVAGASYQWSTASGVFNATTQNPVITNVTTNYATTFYVIASLNGCVGDTGFVTVAVVTPAVANAGGDKTVCANNATVQLNGTISGQDTKTGIWKSDGSGRFTPSESALNASYLPSAGDTARGTVTLTLTTTNNKYCAVNSSAAIVNITDAPVAVAGPDKTVCSNDSLVTLQGFIANAGSGQWYSTGSGRFSRSGNGDLNPVYIPSAQDISKGAVQLYLLTYNNGDCLAVADTVATQIIKAPKVDAGPDRTVFLNDRFVFTPVVTGAAANYRWTPAIDLNDDRVKNAVLIAKNSTKFRLTVSGDSSCTAYDEIFITVLKPILIPNIFSPNGDGIHDTWEIPELNAYPGATVEIFTRGGMKIYSSVGYAKPWDGTYNGNPVPVATYYYIVNPKYNGQLFSGSVTVIR
jgi:gliding motility-associated-like protein